MASTDHQKYILILRVEWSFGECQFSVWIISINQAYFFDIFSKGKFWISPLWNDNFERVGLFKLNKTLIKLIYLINLLKNLKKIMFCLQTHFNTHYILNEINTVSASFSFSLLFLIFTISYVHLLLKIIQIPYEIADHEILC